MLLELAPTLGNYYPGVKSVKEIKVDQDKEGAALQAAGKLQPRQPQQ